MTLLAFYIASVPVIPGRGALVSWLLAAGAAGVALLIDRVLTDRWRRLYRAFLVACGLAICLDVVIAWDCGWMPDWLCFWM